MRGNWVDLPEGGRGAIYTCIQSLSLKSIKIRVCALSILSFVGLSSPIGDGSLNAAEDSFEEQAVELPFSSLPRLWNIRLTGADLARERFTAAQNSEPVTVVVYDEPIGELAEDRIALPEWKTRYRYLPKWSIPTLTKMLQPKPSQDESPEMGSAGIVDTFQISDDQSLSISFLSLISMISLPPEAMEGRDLSEYVQIEDPRELLKPKMVGHGRHVVGTIGALGKDFGVFPHIIPIELGIFNAPIYRQEEEIQQAFDALSNFDRRDFVINMSVAFSSAPDFAHQLDRIINEKNANVVIAAGNSSSRIEKGDFLEDLSDATVVSALSHFGAPAGFTNYGSRVDLLAPGVDITSFAAKSNEDRTLSGTSMASPLVAGAIAELRALLPKARYQDLQQILYRTAWDVLAKGKDEYSGNGLINIYKAAYVANRIRFHGARSQDEISVAVQNPQFFNTQMEWRRAVIQKNQSDELSEAYSKNLYAEILMSNRVRDFSKMHSYYENRFPTYSMGLQNLAFNQEAMTPEVGSEDFKQWTQKLAYLQILSWLTSPRDFGILKNLQSGDAFLEVYRILIQRDFDDAVFGEYRSPFQTLLGHMVLTGNLQTEMRKLCEDQTPELLPDFDALTASVHLAPPQDERGLFDAPTSGI